MSISRATERYLSTQPGIESWHCFAAGANYDPDNISFGPLLAVDEHLVEPRAGFDWHAHRGVDIVTHVITGTLRHEGSDGHVIEVASGGVLVQITGSGISHRETNPSVREPLRLVQSTLLGDTGVASVRLDTAHPVVVSAATLDRTGEGAAPRWHLFIVSGTQRYEGHALVAGDSVRGTGPFVTAGTGALIVVRMPDNTAATELSDIRIERHPN